MKQKTIFRTAGRGALAAALAAGAAAVDFGLTFLYSLIPEANDGICGPSLLMRFFWGEDGWTRVRYFEVFRGALLLACFLLLAAGVLLAAARRKR